MAISLSTPNKDPSSVQNLGDYFRFLPKPQPKVNDWFHRSQYGIFYGIRIFELHQRTYTKINIIRQTRKDRFILLTRMEGFLPMLLLDFLPSWTPYPWHKNMEDLKDDSKSSSRIYSMCVEYNTCFSASVPLNKEYDAKYASRESYRSKY